MTRTTPTGRPGVTLIEVLVAIFVMALGLMALLTLFPLGALNMAQAIKDNRTGNAAQNAAAVANSAWRIATALNPGNPDLYLADVLLNPDNPSTDNPVIRRPIPTPNPAPDGMMPNRGGRDAPSYFAFVDGFGYSSFTGAHQYWVAGKTNGIGRTNLQIIETSGVLKNQLLQYYFVARDDLTFDPNGRAGYGGFVDREGRYSWSYLVRRPRASDARVLDVSVVVYSKRSLSVNPGTLLPESEVDYDAVFTKGSRTAVVSWDTSSGKEAPPLRRGGWILDATAINPASPTPDPLWVPRGHFYRVEDISDPVAAGTRLSVNVELRTPALESSPQQPPLPPGVYGTAVIMPEVVEVFDKGTLFP